MLSHTRWILNSFLRESCSSCSYVHKLTNLPSLNLPWLQHVLTPWFPQLKSYFRENSFIYLPRNNKKFYNDLAAKKTTKTHLPLSLQIWDSSLPNNPVGRSNKKFLWLNELIGCILIPRRMKKDQDPWTSKHLEEKEEGHAENPGKVISPPPYPT